MSHSISGYAVGPNNTWRSKPFGAEQTAFSVYCSTHEQQVFLNSSVLSAETSSDGKRVRLHFKGGLIGPWFTADSESLTFAKVVKGVFTTMSR